MPARSKSGTPKAPPSGTMLRKKGKRNPRKKK
jgi:hypothetical protein